ncbi:hypothetical protein EES43_19720 [Streptomyces sp. ADI96-02]|nr:hypothetical protein EES43_19720 [Streptomyces sp. ADI96-02]
MRIGLLTEGGHPCAKGEFRLRCDRLVRGLPQREFDPFTLSRSARQEDRGRLRPPERVSLARTAPLRTPEDATLRGSGARGLPGRLAKRFFGVPLLVAGHGPDPWSRRRGPFIPAPRLLKE